jgi:glucose-1-phosphate cytidylyltransferase
MKVVILAGGFGTRISEESHLIPKPMVEIGDKPILWHIMKYYSYYGFNDFIICAGYKQYAIKEYFSDYFLHLSDITFDFKNENSVIIHTNKTEPWKVTIIDTGIHTMTGGRIKRVSDFIGNETFMLTYGDGVSDVDIHKLLKFHKDHNKIATITAIQPGGRFGILDINNKYEIESFKEKNKDDSGWINGGFMVLEPEIFKFIDGDQTVLENEPMVQLTKIKELIAYKHEGFWQCMDTLRDKHLLENLWKSGDATWKKW